MPPHPRRATLLTLAAAAVPLSLPLTPARAANISWSSPTSGRWSDPTHWSTGTVPTTGDSVTIDAPGTYTVTSDPSSYVGPVTLNAPDATLSIANYRDSLGTTAFTLSAGTLALGSDGYTETRVFLDSFANAGTVTFDADIPTLQPTSLASINTGPGKVINTGTIEAHPSPPAAPGQVHYPDFYGFTGRAGTTFTNTGTLRTIGSSILAFVNYTLNQNAGSIDGRIEFNAGTFNYNGGSFSPAANVTLYGSSLKIAPTATTGNFFLDYGSSLVGNIPAGNTLTTWSTNSIRWDGFSPTNAGHLIVGSYTWGPLSTYASPTLNLGSSSTLLNTGTLELNSPNLTAAYLKGSVTNQGAVVINASNTAYYNVPTRVVGSFTQNGGSLTIDPATSLSLSSPDSYSTVGFYFNGGTVTGPVTLNNITTHFAPGLADTGGGTFTYSTTSTSPAKPFTGDIPSGATFVHAASSVSSFSLSSFTNNGTLRTFGNTPYYTLNSGAGTLTNTGSFGGTINGADRGIALQLYGNLTNTGAIKAYNLTVYQAVFNQNAGTLDVDAHCNVSSGTFNYNGGTLTGKPVGLFSSTLNIAPNTNPASFQFYGGNSTLHGNITPSSSLTLDTFIAGSATITVTADPFTNAGTLSLPATVAVVKSTLTIPNNGTLTNTGTLSVTAGKGGTRTLNAHVLNTGTLSVGPNATLTLTGSLSTTTPLDLQGTLDLRGPLTWSYAPTSPSPIDTLRSLLAAGHLTDSAADPSHRLAYTDTGTSLTASLALTGDTNLDGQITPDDYALLDRSYARSLSDAHWTDGDFNYDGTVDQNDYLLIDTTLAQSQGLSPTLLSTRESQFGPAYVSTLLASVPEPASLTTLLLLLPLTRRRRRTLKIRRTFQ